MRLPRRRFRLLALGTSLLLGLTAVLLYLNHPRILVGMAQYQLGPLASATSLAGYEAMIQAQPIVGLDRNASGLTYSMASDTLFAVSNRPPALFELSTDGQLLRHIPLPDLDDPEGITHVDENLFLVSVESGHRLYGIRVAEDAEDAEAIRPIDLSLDFPPWHNLGLEGISWDQDRRTLLLTNEQLPKRVLLVRGLRPGAADQPESLDIRTWRPREWMGILGLDLASVTTCDSAGNLLLLSEASGLIMEYSREGQLLGVLPMWAGFHRLTATAPQPEGIAVGPDRSIYVISEPNLFYRFVPATANARQ